MNIKIDYLKNHPNLIEEISEYFYPQILLGYTISSSIYKEDCLKKPD